MGCIEICCGLKTSPPLPGQIMKPACRDGWVLVVQDSLYLAVAGPHLFLHPCIFYHLAVLLCIIIRLELFLYIQPEKKTTLYHYCHGRLAALLLCTKRMQKICCNSVVQKVKRMMISLLLALLGGRHQSCCYNVYNGIGGFLLFNDDYY